MCFGGSSDNSDYTDQLRDQAVEDRRAEELRKGRLNYLNKLIDRAFHGGPARPEVEEYNWNKFKRVGDTAQGLPEGYTFVQGGDGVWKVRDPNGKMHEPGTFMTVATGRTEPAQHGFDKNFYDNYRSAISGYYMPQVEDQYGDAKDETTFRLARAGTLQSQVANDKNADLVKQNIINRGLIADKADQGVAGLKKTVGDTETNIRNLASASEDPTASVNAALAQVPNLQLAKPELSALGEMFKVATIGMGNAISGYQAGRTTADANALARRYNTNSGAVNVYT